MTTKRPSDPSSGDARRRALLDHADVPLFSTELDGTVLDANAAAGTALGIDVALGRPEALLLCVSDTDAECVRRVLETIAGTSVADIELHLRSPGGRELWAVRAKFGPEAHAVLWSAATIADREASGLRRMVLDKTELLERERERVEMGQAANDAKDRLLAIVGEDSSATLNAVLGWTRMLRREVLSTAARDMALAVVEGNVERHLALVSDLLEIARIVEGHAQLDLRRIEIVPFVEKSLAAIMATAAEKGVAVAFRAPGVIQGPGVEVLGDIGKLGRLVHGAVEVFLGAASRGDRVVVEVAHDDGSCVLRATSANVAPAGPAPLPRSVTLPANAVHATAELAFLLVERTARVHGGLATQLANPHGGRVVEVRLPCVDRVSRLAVPPPRIAPPLHGVRVLVFDQDHEMRELASIHLREHGATVLGARDASTVAAAVARFRPDVLIADVESVGDHLFASAITRDASRRPFAIVGLTSSNRRGGAIGEARRADIVVERPFDAKTLVAAVRHCRDVRGGL